MENPFKKTKQVDLEVFTIYDSKTQSYGEPTCAVNHHDIIRQLLNMFKDPNQAHNKYLVNAEDYSLFRIGKYDKKSGQLDSTNLEHVANLNDLRAIAQPMNPGPGIVPT